MHDHAGLKLTAQMDADHDRAVIKLLESRGFKPTTECEWQHPDGSHFSIYPTSCQGCEDCDAIEVARNERSVDPDGLFL